MASNGSFYQNGLPISSAETGLGNVPQGPLAPKTAESSFYLSGSIYQTVQNQDALLALLTADTALVVADLVSANAAAANAAASAAAATATLASSLKIASNLSDLASVPTALINIGLNNVNNTSDVNKPVSTAQATADALVASNASAATALKANIASPTLTGVPAAPTASPGTNTTQLATTAFVDAARVILAAADALKAPLASPALTGVPTAPTAAPATNTTQLATTAYADAINTALTAALALKAPLASPAFTGAPTAPTATVGTNTTQLATTAFVLANATSVSPATVAPLIDGTAAVGTSLLYARQDHVHPTDNSRAALASPTFTGVPAAPTATLGTNTTQLATTAFVLANSSGGSTVLPGYISNLSLGNNVTNPTTDIDFVSVTASDSTAAVTMIGPTMTKQLHNNWAAGTAAGMRNSGTAIANGTYHLYLVSKAAGANPDYYAHTSTNVATVISALQLETGGASYIYARRIGSIIRAAAAIVLFTQSGFEFLLKTTVQDITTTNAGTAAVLATLSVPAGIQVSVKTSVGLAVGTSTTALYVSSPDQTDIVPVATGAFTVALAGSSVPMFVGNQFTRTNTSGQVRYRLSSSDASTTVRIVTFGWIDSL